ncbi:MAG: MogA/MoaB family molybdenum cofactor biosynthesis protein [Spirochaetales bacterium]|jgi:molybdenum cofactor synthesis domain-containing protein|nr:MogA/MoaB family molybdenum cofactor biosynthesis protein [Spirochaetales bacterium]
MGNEAPSGRAYRVSIITASDKGVRGERVDESGPLIRRMVLAAGYRVGECLLLSDDQEGLEKEMRRICDDNLADLILTTGGTGFSPRDRMPEASAAVGERPVPGIPEAMRQYSLGLTKRAMLGRGTAVIRGKTLIVNLPGSPKAVEEQLSFILTELPHGLDMLTGL